MTFRAVVQDGLIVVNTHGAIADGTRVEISVPKGSRGGARVRQGSRAKLRGKKGRGLSDRPLIESPAIGLWQDRKEWKGKSTLEIARELREKFLGGRRHG